MSSAPRHRAGAAALIGLVAVSVTLSQRPGAAEPAAAQPAGGGQTIGMAGCAATGCHGRPETTPGVLPPDVWHESFTRWIDRDPHTRAYAALESPLGKAISKRLHAGDSSIPADATRDFRCLACHSNPALAREDLVRPNPADDPLNRMRAEGVSCEACHGNAERWQIAHTSWTNPATRATEFAHHGMIDLNDWSVQAKTCAGCHVGAAADKDRGYPVRDMNHDMIAAGHPRLEFDFAAFQAKLSKHWFPKHRGPSPDPGRDNALHGWLLGQIAVEEAYCELSIDRIERGTKGEPRSVLPEFADWNCSQCHHRLVPAEWRAEAAKGQTQGKAATRKLGQPTWIGASSILPPETVPQYGQNAKKQLEALRARKERLAFPLLKPPGGQNPDFRKKIVELLSGPWQTSPWNWEEANRHYLALRSLDASLRTAGASPTAEVGERFGQFQLSLWGTAEPPVRREHTDKAAPGYRGYQRKPESRWLWEKNPAERPKVEDTVADLRRLLRAELQKLPP